MHNELKRIVDLLESHLGDSDGYLPDDLSQEELEDEFPVEAALQIAVKLMIETENAAPPALTDAARDVLGERLRQVTAEGWTPAHDDEHEIGELARAAACYAANATGYRLQSRINIWPWDREWWKPSTPRRDLIKAGALILAEIERLDRRALTAAQSASGLQEDA